MINRVVQPRYLADGYKDDIATGSLPPAEGRLGRYTRIGVTIIPPINPIDAFAEQIAVSTRFRHRKDSK